MNAGLLRSEADRRLLERLAEERGLDPQVALDLVAAAEEHVGMIRRRGMFLRFDSILGKASN